MQNDYINDVGFRKFVFNPFMENTYLVWDKTTMEAVIIDPGNSDAAENKVIESYIEENNLLPRFLINTHGHIDHILGNAFILKRYSPEFLYPDKDLYLYQNAEAQAKIYGVNFTRFDLKGNCMTDNMRIKAGAVELELLYTPGHTPGEFCVHIPEHQLLFSGDVIFLESIGRTDLPGGSEEDLLQSIMTRLFSLNDATIIFPGHGQVTSVGSEKENNPFFY